MTEAAPPTRLTDHKRDAIVQAAIAEFREHGFKWHQHGPRGRRRRSLQAHGIQPLPSKDELFEAILSSCGSAAIPLADVAYDAAAAAQLLEVLEQKMLLLGDASFTDLSRVALAEMMHAPGYLPGHGGAPVREGRACRAGSAPRKGAAPRAGADAPVRGEPAARHGQVLRLLAAAGHNKASSAAEQRQVLGMRGYVSGILFSQIGF